MISLIACIVCGSILYIIFKGFEMFKVDLLQAIVVNYIVAGVLGFILASANNNVITPGIILNAPWFPYAIVIGFMFITIFNLMGLSSQKAGVSVTSVANKMSVIIPVIFGFIVFHEAVTVFKIAGILLAIVALYLVTRKESDSVQSIAYPVIIFFASGVLDTILGYCSRLHVTGYNTVVFTASLFTVAALLGLSYLLVLVASGKQTLEMKNILGGIVLGVPNFASILFVFKGLKETGWDVSVFFPVLNMGTVVMAAVFAFIFFREKLSVSNLAGVGIAILAIYLISLA
ncbi:MAG TPA: DMT family transporter [Flavobacteriales bacterium]|nr:DMT family transporter [Flavobacteriales bacterium]